MRAAGGTCYGYICDLCDREDVYKKAQLLKDEVGRVQLFLPSKLKINLFFSNWNANKSENNIWLQNDEFLLGDNLRRFLNNVFLLEARTGAYKDARL